MDTSSIIELARKIFSLEWPFTEKDLKAKYRRIVKELRPDLNRNAGKFGIVQEAYESLLAALRKRFSKKAVAPVIAKGQIIDIYV